MNTKNDICTYLQEKIAWEKELSSEELDHCINCGPCGELMLQFEELDALIKNEVIHVPTDFASNVMTAIDSWETHITGAGQTKFSANQFINSLLRWSVAGGSLLITMAAH